MTTPSTPAHSPTSPNAPRADGALALFTPDGVPVRLDAFAGSTLVVQLVRYFGCLPCQVYLRDLDGRADALAAVGARAIAIGVGLWLAAMAVLVAHFGFDGLLTQMAWFFTKAALLTFGGAYAVLPYVYQGAVEHHGWLSGPQMIAGLALGETTPGPLIMVVAFVGFVGAWQAPLFGAESMLASGVLAACVVTFFTFLPSFVFIFAGAPLVEATHGELRFTAPLTAITAAVVGVIVNLALFFAGHVFWPQGFAAAVELPAVAIAAAALLALLRLGAGVIPVIAASAVAGLIWHLASV